MGLISSYTVYPLAIICHLLSVTAPYTGVATLPLTPYIVHEIEIQYSYSLDSCFHPTYACWTGLFTVSDVHSMTDEILKMKHFDHPNVMTLIGVCVSVGGGPAIVMPFMENGSLLNYLRRDKKNITIKDDQDLETVSCTYVAVYHSQCPQCDSSHYSTPTSRIGIPHYLLLYIPL